jgi:hypothetical protein
MNKTLLVFIAITTVVLTGCGSSPRSPEAEQCMRSTERMSSDRWNCLTEASRQSEARTIQQQRNNREVEELHSLRRRCDGFGFRNGTPEYSQCLMKLQQQDNENRFRAAQVNQEQEKIRQQSLRDFNDAIKPPAFAPLPCPSGMMRGGKCVGN